MNLTINETKENALLFRKEVSATILFEGKTTPSRKEVQAELAKQTKAKATLVLVLQINTNFGEAKAIVKAHIYDNEEVMNTLERKNLVEKHVGHEPKKVEE